MSRTELLVLVEERLAVDLDTARRAWGIGRTKAFELAAKGELPFPVNRLGSSYVVPTMPLLRSLGIAIDCAPVPTCASLECVEDATAEPASAPR